MVRVRGGVGMRTSKGDDNSTSRGETPNNTRNSPVTGKKGEKRKQKKENERGS